MSRILCVDDNDNNLYMLNTVLSRAGYAVLSAISGEEAVSLVAAERPDLVVMDLTLPGIDGCEAMRRIRALPVVGSIPIVVLSGHSEEDKGALARAAGCDGYARKPIQIRPLLTLIATLLSSGAASPPAVLGGSPSK